MTIVLFFMADPIYANAFSAFNFGSSLSTYSRVARLKLDREGRAADVCEFCQLIGEVGVHDCAELSAVVLSLEVTRSII